jgi:ABC-type sulfate transport system substrate-binding protein
LALAADIDAIAGAGLLPKDWRIRPPENSAPQQSTLAFLVRTTTDPGPTAGRTEVKRR